MSGSEAGDTGIQGTHPGEEVHSHDRPLSTGVDEQNEGAQLKIDSVEFKLTTQQVHSEV